MRKKADFKKEMKKKTWIKVEKILKGNLDSIPSPSPSVKIQIMKMKKIQAMF